MWSNFLSCPGKKTNESRLQITTQQNTPFRLEETQSTLLTVETTVCMKTNDCLPAWMIMNIYSTDGGNTYHFTTNDFASLLFSVFFKRNGQSEKKHYAVYWNKAANGDALDFLPGRF